jgi:hypothetical protein
MCVYMAFCIHSFVGTCSAGFSIVCLFVFLWVYPRSGITGSNGSFSFSFFKEHHTDLHGGWTNLDSHHQWNGVSFSSHPLQYLLLFVFLMIAIVIRMR